MVTRAKLSAPREERSNWPWHHAKWTALSSTLLMGGDRRMEAETYLAGGYGLRLALEARKVGLSPLVEMANVWQPSRLKGIVVSREYGTPFLAATQVFDLRPVPRKFLSLLRTDNAAQRFASPGMILVTCSGSVGRATLTHKPHENTLISHDLLRVEARNPEFWGWLYAYLRSSQARAMMKAVHYGHVIKHLETSHLDALPIPTVKPALRENFNKRVQEVLHKRTSAFELMIQAEQQYSDCFPSFVAEEEPLGYTVKASEMFGHRRRLDGSCYIPYVKRVVEAFKRHAVDVVPLSSVTTKVFVPGRFKHVYGVEGTPYLDSADILEVNPDVTKRVLSLSPEEQKQYRVEAGMVLIPCSGQVHGNIGHAVLSTEWHTGKVLSNHILRVCPNDTVRSGYLQCVLGHPVLGRPQVIRFAFGSSVPELAAGDVASVSVPRLDKGIERDLADMMEKAAKVRDEADEMEQAIATDAEEIIDRFIAGDTSDVVMVGA